MIALETEPKRYAKMENTMDNNMTPLNSSLAKESSVNASRSKENDLALPNPSMDAISHSEQLLSTILKTIETKDEGIISFAEYMQLALYAPGLGYYSAGNQKFGSRGDFVTAPEISPLFSQCLAHQCFQGLTQLGEDACILEIGAGSGQMAADILRELNELGRLPKQYYILELSAELKERQKQKLQTQCPELFPRVQWLDALPSTAIKAIILANEVCDAMPMHRFCLKYDGCSELAVACKDNKLSLIEKVPSPELAEALELLLDDLAKASFNNTGKNNRDNSVTLNSTNTKEKSKCKDIALSNLLTESSQYLSEINLNIKPWIKALAEILESGLILIIDYGFARQEYYHPSRHMGTLMCHYRHHSHADVFFYPGLQDITAHVDFTAIAEAAIQCQLEVAGFTNQAAFLIGSGLQDSVEKNKDKGMTEKEIFKQNQAIQLLTSPAEMGELFKAIALSKNFEIDLRGFMLQDMRNRL